MNPFLLLILCVLVSVAQSEVHPITYQCYNADMFKKRRSTSESWLEIVSNSLKNAVKSIFGTTESEGEERHAMRPYFSNVIDGSECVPYVGDLEKKIDSSEAMLAAATMAPLGSLSEPRRDVTRLHFFSGSDEAIKGLLKSDQSKEETSSKNKNDDNRVLRKKNTVLLIVPGGSYERISKYESQTFPFDVIERAAKDSVNDTQKKSISFLPVVVQYRVTPLDPYSPAEDISFAVRLLARYRSHAKVNFMKSPMSLPFLDYDSLLVNWSLMDNSTVTLDPASLGLEENFNIIIIGFSAGAHAAATYVAKSSLIPIQAVILIYPVISMENPDIYHQASTKNLLGIDIKSIFPRTDGNDGSISNLNITDQNSTQGEVDFKKTNILQSIINMARNFSINNFPHNFPRCVYITHTKDDPRVSVKHSQYMFDALVKHRKENTIFMRSGKNKGLGLFRLQKNYTSFFEGGGGMNKTYFDDKYDVALRIYPTGPHGRWSSQEDPVLSNWWVHVVNWLTIKRSMGKCIY